MDPFSFVSKWFWAIALAMGFINAFIMKKRSQPYIASNPELEPGYRRIIKGYAMGMSAPFAVMGIGCTIGGVPTVFHFFRMRDANPYVLAFFISVVMVWVMGTYWLVFLDGANKLVRHPGLFNFRTQNPLAIIGYWLLAVSGGIAGLAMMHFMDIPLPQ